ncbi:MULTISPECIES: ATP-dependent DNA ligase [unclassified Leptolyngbya]|uniref:ATP-dependent DNA ligase n=1 Tax=unclassified Leptolyngbya TaxID=2650499 RepID=UPI001682F554|nr:MULTISPECIES: ATP-dependent DNA ligase [unclassified Leptolyngbya]MBD1909441.1 ATP-dependent DNA ligase [Leptolyngbya sp. FACHB-8]MBD2155662.1 ATP-dependent DNA ligase [Leptolyngbya sp. FACHB-16]
MIQDTYAVAVNAFQRFAIAAEAIAATTKRLTKAAILGDYFNTLSDNDLRLAARYFAGSPFPLFDQRVLQVGGSALMTALVVVSGEDPERLQTELVQRGDLGDVAASVLDDVDTPILLLSEVESTLATLVETRGNKKKVDVIISLLRRATSLEAKYLIKLMAGDLRIGLREGAVEDAIARLAQQNVARIQWVNMLTGDIGETAVLARHDQLDTAHMRLFHPIKFMLASPVDDLAEITQRMPEGFAVEDKYDGIRAQAHIAPASSDKNPLLHGATFAGIRVALFSRTLDEITLAFPDLVQPLASMKRDAFGMGADAGLILDGEIVPYQNGRILPFQELQKRLGRKTLTDDLLKSVPVAFVAYDILYRNGQVLIEEPYEVRQAMLESLGLESPTVQRVVSQRFYNAEALDAEFQAARDRGNEGLMVKALQSTYKPGKRGKDWLKVKRAIATLDVVITAAEVGTGKRSRFLSDYTFAVRASEDDPTLLNVGKAYSGLTDAEVQELSDWLKAHTIQEFAHGRVRTVEPRVVLEVTFDRVQPSKRHKSGYALRFPRILRIRHDKPPEEADTLETVRQLAAQMGSEDVEPEP